MSESPVIYRVGSLSYTKPKLAVLFCWLLWGDFCYMLMETVVPSILPLKFRHLGADNVSIGLIMTTLPMIINTVLNPIISFKSDRYRSRWGRRIPFILFTLPILVVLLLGVGFADKMGVGIYGWLGGIAGAPEGHNVALDWVAAKINQMTPNQFAIVMIGIMMVLFSIVNTFVNSVFWYLFNDVVPEHLLARFMSWFRVVITISAAFYNFCIFRFAETHATEIFIGAAILYFVGFGLMCLNVKEGQYPPSPPLVPGSSPLVAAFKTFGKECHSVPHYWYVFLLGMSFAAANAIGPFGLLFSLSLGMDLKMIGILGGVGSIAGSVTIVISGWLADRYHPIRIVLWGVIAQIVLALPVACIWIFWKPEPNVVFWVSIATAIILGAPIGAMLGVLDPPMFMRIFPRERYGQFCSANAMWRSISLIISGSLAGVFLDVLGKKVGKEQAYCYLPVWQLVFMILMLYFMVKLYKSWKAYGGDDHYVAVVPDFIKDKEEEESVRALAQFPDDRTRPIL